MSKLAIYKSRNFMKLLGAGTDADFDGHLQE